MSENVVPVCTIHPSSVALYYCNTCGFICDPDKEHQNKTCTLVKIDANIKGQYNSILQKHKAEIELNFNSELKSNFLAYLEQENCLLERQLIENNIAMQPLINDPSFKEFSELAFKEYCLNKEAEESGYFLKLQEEYKKILTIAKEKAIKTYEALK